MSRVHWPTFCLITGHCVNNIWGEPYVGAHYRRTGTIVRTQYASCFLQRLWNYFISNSNGMSVGRCECLGSLYRQGRLVRHWKRIKFVRTLRMPLLPVWRQMHVLLLVRRKTMPMISRSPPQRVWSVIVTQCSGFLFVRWNFRNVSNTCRSGDFLFKFRSMVLALTLNVLLFVHFLWPLRFRVINMEVDARDTTWCFVNFQM